MTEDQFLKLNSHEAFAYAATFEAEQKTYLLRLYKDRIGIDPIEGDVSFKVNREVAAKDLKQWKIAAVLFVICIVPLVSIFSCTMNNIEKGPPPPTMEDKKRDCERARYDQQLRNNERERAKAELTDAETALSADTPELMEYYKSAMEAEMGLLPGEGNGWKTVYAGRKREAAQRVRSLGAIEYEQPLECIFTK